MSIIKDSIDSTSFLEAGTAFARIASGPMSVTTDRQGGTFINGPVSISSGLSSIRFGPIFKFNPYYKGASRSRY